jgi:hypothetical protein
MLGSSPVNDVLVSAAHLADMSLMADILLIILRSSASLLLF